jgi:hypothetical protein
VSLRTALTGLLPQIKLNAAASTRHLNLPENIDNRVVEADLVDQLFNSSEKRLARALLLLANFGKEGQPEPIIAKVSQETLAEMIGTTRSRVSFFHEQISKIGFDCLQWPDRNPPLIAEPRSA